MQWTPLGRGLVFVLSATSIWSLLVVFYRLGSMRTFTVWGLVPASAALVVLCVADAVAGDGRLWRAVAVGAVGGLLAAFSYDLFRLPWVIGAVDHIGPMWMRLPWFKVFPRFGAMILNVPYTAAQTDSQFPLSVHVVGWAYHFSNGVTFGIMYMALLGDARRHTWLWGVVFAMGLELGMLFTPYPVFFGIDKTPLFIANTMTAHAIFGAVLGLYTRRESMKWPGKGSAAARKRVHA